MSFLFAGSYCIMFLLFCQVIVKYKQPELIMHPVIQRLMITK